MRIPRIPRRILPTVLPSREAMRSWGHDEFHYSPDMWDIEYVTYRYLAGISDEELHDRYDQILRNMASYMESGRDVIPLISYQSSWYWFRKDHHTRLEFSLRGFEPELLPVRPALLCGPVSIPGPVPNGADVIFRYGKRKYMHEMVREGRLRFVPAQTYFSVENNEARRDEELQKTSYLPGRYTKITMLDGRPISLIGDIKESITGAGYHLLCFSCVWDKRLFADFDADTCVAVVAPDKLFARIESVGRDIFNGWYFHHNPVQYFDPYHKMKNEYISASMSKDFRFSYQNEYRIVWARLNAIPIEEERFVTIGEARDIMKMYDVDGAEI